MKVPIQQIGLGMVQQMQQHVCPECRVELISEKDKCPLCRGNKVTQEKMVLVLEVHVEKGMQHGQKIVFERQADEAPDSITRGCCCTAIERAPQF